MLARRAAAEIDAGGEHRRALIPFLVQHERGFAFPVVKEERPEPRSLNSFQELLWNDLIGVDVVAAQRRDAATMHAERLAAPGHQRYSHERTSVNRPSMAAAAAMAGLTRCVRPPRPCRPSKLRLLVDAQRSPSPRMSSFMPRHIEQPGSRHSKPASAKIRSSPSRSASALTFCDPGTTSARTRLLTLCPFATLAAARRSSMRALVHDPMNTRSIGRLSIAVPGVSPM